MIAFLLSLTRKKIGRILFLTVLLLLLIFFEFIAVNDSLIFVGQKLTQPILQLNVKLAASIYQTASNVRTWQNSARRVQDLELKLAYTSAQLGQIEQLQQENKKLRELLNSTDRDLNQVVLTSPILSLAQPAVSLPRDVAVTPGLAVLVENTLVGVVKEVINNVGYVSLLWQQDTPFVLAQSSTGVQGLLKGDGRRVLLTEVPVEDELEVGQRVITSGQEGIEAGIYIGEIRSIKSGASSAVKTAVLEQYVSFHESSLVEIKLQ